MGLTSTGNNLPMQWVRFTLQIIVMLVVIAVAFGTAKQQIAMNTYRIEQTEQTVVAIQEKAIQNLAELRATNAALRQEIALLRGDVREIKLLLKNALHPKR